MGTSASFNGTNYTVPAVGDRNWGPQVTALLISLAGNALSKAGGNFVLTADVNFGSNYGLTAKYLKSVTSNIAQSGVVRFANNEGAAWRNAANSADLVLKLNGSNRLELDGVAIPTISSTDTLTNKSISAASNTISGLAKTDVGLGNVDNTSDATKNAATANLTNKTIVSPVIDDYMDVNHESAPSAPSSGKVRIYAKSDSKIYKKDSAGTETQLATTAEALSNPMTTAGDIIYGGALGVATRLAGAAGVLHGAVGSAPSFSTIVNADVSASAAIAYSKLNLGSSIVNADVSSSAAIANSKIAIGSSFSAYLNSSTSIPGSATFTTVVFGSTRENDAGHYNVSTGIYTAPSAGRYIFTYGMRINIAATATSDINARIYVNNTTSYALCRLDSLASAKSYHLGDSLVIKLAAGDTVRIQVSSGSQIIDVDYGTGGQAFFSGCYLGA